MASVASQIWSGFNFYANSRRKKSKFAPRRGIFYYHGQDEQFEDNQIGRREILLRSSDLATISTIFHFSGTKSNYLGVQKNPTSLALCPATKNCVSTSENRSDLTHYAPPWNYNPESGRGSRNPVSKEVAMQDLLDVVSPYVVLLLL